jgi:hypothetical protein
MMAGKKYWEVMYRVAAINPSGTLSMLHNRNKK